MTGAFRSRATPAAAGGPIACGSETGQPTHPLSSAGAGDNPQALGPVGPQQAGPVLEPHSILPRAREGDIIPRYVLERDLGLFAEYQPIYADQGITTFPVVIENGQKKPAIKNYRNLGPAGSTKLRDQFIEADALGFVAAPRMA